MSEPYDGRLNEREQSLRLIDSLLDTYRPEGVLIWLTSGNRHLDGFSPQQMIREGQWQRLIDEADRLAGGPFAQPRRVRTGETFDLAPFEVVDVVTEFGGKEMHLFHLDGGPGGMKGARIG